MSPVNRDIFLGVMIASVVLPIGIAISFVYVEREKRADQLRTLVPPSPLDIWRIEPLPDGNYETFRRAQYGGTAITCYAISEPKKNKALFHHCTFEYNQIRAYDIPKRPIVKGEDSK